MLGDLAMKLTVEVAVMLDINNIDVTSEIDVCQCWQICLDSALDLSVCFRSWCEHGIRHS